MALWRRKTRTLSSLLTQKCNHRLIFLHSSIRCECNEIVSTLTRACKKSIYLQKINNIIWYLFSLLTYHVDDYIGAFSGEWGGYAQIRGTDRWAERLLLLLRLILCSYYITETGRLPCVRQVRQQPWSRGRSARRTIPPIGHTRPSLLIKVRFGSCQNYKNDSTYT